MITIGVDPGTNITGYGVVSGAGNDLVCLGWGVIKTTKGAPLPKRLKQISDGLGKAIVEHGPACMSLEESFFAKNVQSALKLGMARGVIMLVAEEAGIPVYEYSPLLIKQTTTGYGRADKDQVREMVKQMLSISVETPPLDASDALAAAITHSIHYEFERRTAQ